MRLQSPKTEYGAQNQYGRVIYPSIGNFTWSMTKYTVGGQKGKNWPSESKNGIWGPKSVWSCHISIEREFHVNQKKYTLEGQKDKNKPLES
jgi:hypothetical protein